LNRLHVDRHGLLNSLLRDRPVQFRLPWWISIQLDEPSKTAARGVRQ
jgi:hypothetical protein